MSGTLTSAGRGGAGNFVDVTNSPKVQPKDLETPTLKTSVVTTGRGGSGNMQKNSDPVDTRALQDVQPVARRESGGASHVGRGGTGNVFKPEDAEAARKAGGSAIADEKVEKGLAAKGKDWLLGKK